MSLNRRSGHKRNAFKHRSFRSERPEAKQRYPQRQRQQQLCYPQEDLQKPINNTYNGHYRRKK